MCVHISDIQIFIHKEFLYKAQGDKPVTMRTPDTRQCSPPCCLGYVLKCELQGWKGGEFASRAVATQS